MHPQEEPTVVTEEDQRAAKCRQARWKLQKCYFPATQVLPESLLGVGWGQEGEREVRELWGERQVQGFSLQASSCLLGFSLALLSPCTLASGASPRSLWPPSPQSYLPPSEGSRSMRSGAGGTFTVRESSPGLERMTQSRERKDHSGGQWQV